jgi:hypothetical protein
VFIYKKKPVGGTAAAFLYHAPTKLLQLLLSEINKTTPAPGRTLIAFP